MPGYAWARARFGACSHGDSSESIRVLGLRRRPPARSCSRRWSSDPAFRLGEASDRDVRPLLEPVRHWPLWAVHWQHPLAFRPGSMGPSRLRRPAARIHRSRRSRWLAAPAGDSLPISRARLQDPVLAQAHGPLVSPAVRTRCCQAHGSAVSTRCWLTGPVQVSRQPSVPGASSGPVNLNVTCTRPCSCVSAQWHAKDGLSAASDSDVHSIHAQSLSTVEVITVLS